LAWCKDSATLLQGRVTATFNVLLLVTNAKGKTGVLLIVTVVRKFRMLVVEQFCTFTELFVLWWF